MAKCPKCGTRVYKGDAYCGDCGAKLKGAKKFNPSSARRKATRTIGRLF